MSELILSDITRMAGGYCIIGLEKRENRYRSIRPLPPTAFAWPEDFDFHRGDRLQFELTQVEVFRPHVEDRESTGVRGVNGCISEPELLECLRRAEVAEGVRELFGYPVQPGRHGAHLHAPKASRSICGAEARKIRLKWEANALRAYVGLAPGEVLPDLPVVDRSWHRFVEEVLRQMRGANRGQRLNRWLGERMQEVPGCFVRLGLTRPHPPPLGRCQVMLDTLLPMPRLSWVEEALAELG